MIVLLVVLFICGYLLITLEHFIKINKAAIALVTGVLCWVTLITYESDKNSVNLELSHHLGELSGILFFLLGAMAIVELIDSHEGFEIITTKITQRNKRKLLWIISLLTFFLSSILDNLTTTIVMVSIVRKLIKDDEDKLRFSGMIVLAANAGGAWSPIGDVTTTMLWIGGQITTMNIITTLFFPSLVCLIVPLIYLTFRMKGTVQRPAPILQPHSRTLTPKQQTIILFSGILMLVLVPVFKTVTHLPPYMGILIGLGILWILTELLHSGKNDEEKHVLSVVSALRKIDAPSILFFFGILVSISALGSAGVLSGLASWMKNNIANENLIILSLGTLSSLVDNVPLVAAAQGMYDLSTYPTDHYFWEFLAYATGTGGSILIIGSAAGVAAMGIEKIPFFWYLKRISLLAIMGYLSGAAIVIIQHNLLK